MKSFISTTGRRQKIFSTLSATVFLFTPFYAQAADLEGLVNKADPVAQTSTGTEAGAGAGSGNTGAGASTGAQANTKVEDLVVLGVESTNKTSTGAQFDTGSVASTDSGTAVSKQSSSVCNNTDSRTDNDC